LACKKPLRLSSEVLFRGTKPSLKQHTHNHFIALFFWDYRREPVSEENILLDFYGAMEDNRGRHTNHPAEHHSIQTNQRPPPTAPIFTPDALPATTVPLYPGLGQAPNMLACIPSAVIHTQWHGFPATNGEKDLLSNKD